MSVRDPSEVSAALDGGADIVDAKDPARGALGAMAPEMVGRIIARIPDTIPFSAALGDPADALSVEGLINALPLPRRAAAVYVKLGFAGLGSGVGAGRLLQAAVRAAGRHPGQPVVIAVCYADEPTGPDLETTLALARAADAGGVLVDTSRKDGGTLVDLVPMARLRSWATEARRSGLLVGLAGRLGCAELQAVASSGADVVGVRGAACEGGRQGQVSAARVRTLRDALGRVAEDRPHTAKHQSGRRPASVAVIPK